MRICDDCLNRYSCPIDISAKVESCDNYQSNKQLIESFEKNLLQYLQNKYKPESDDTGVKTGVS
jgi:hypothetical protein